MKEIKVNLNIERQDDSVIVGDLFSLQTLFGSTSIGTGLHLYNIKKGKNSYIIPVSELERREEEITKRLLRDKKTLAIINEVLK